MEGNGESQLPRESVEFQKCRAFPLEMYLHEVQGEDCIRAEIIERCPVVVVADGVSRQEDLKTGELKSVEGELAAQKAVETIYKYLAKELPALESVEKVLQCLRDAFDVVARTFQKEEIAGATTLLVLLLWESPSGVLFWCYAYEGDGFITLLAPTRRIDTVLVADRLLSLQKIIDTGVVTYDLLSPQKVEGTAAVTSRGCIVPPAVGCRLHEPDDLVYVASDGFIPIQSWLIKEYKMTLAFLIQSRRKEPAHLEEIIKSCPRYTDDAVFGMIRTEINRGQSDRGTESLNEGLEEQSPESYQHGFLGQPRQR